MDPHQPMHPPAQYYHVQDAHQEKVEQFQHHQQSYQPYESFQTEPNGPVAASPQAAVLSVTRRAAIGTLAVLASLILAVIGLSAGLGVSQRDLHQARGDLQAVLSSAAAAASSSGLATPAAASSSAASPTAAVTDLECPKVNGTVYTASTGGKQFRRMCGVDYGGNGEAVDIGNVKTLNLEACIDACAARGNCTGAGWGILTGDQGAAHECWMKTNLTKFHQATPDWAFAVLLRKA